MSTDIMTSLVINDKKKFIKGQAYANNVFPHTTEPFYFAYSKGSDFQDAIISFLEDITLGALSIRPSANRYKWLYRTNHFLDRLDNYAEKHPQQKYRTDAIGFEWEPRNVFDDIQENDRASLLRLVHDFIHGSSDEPKFPNRREYYLIYKGGFPTRTPKIVNKLTNKKVFFQDLDPAHMEQVTYNFYRSHTLNPDLFKVVHIE